MEPQPTSASVVAAVEVVAAVADGGGVTVEVVEVISVEVVAVAAILTEN